MNPTFFITFLKTKLWLLHVDQNKKSKTFLHMLKNQPVKKRRMRHFARHRFVHLAKFFLFISRR